MTISKTRRPVAAAALAALGLVLLSACNPSSYAVEQSATASALRRVGYSSITSNQVTCSDNGNVTTGSVTAIRSLCRDGSPGVSMQPATVDVVYSGSSATAVVLVSNKVALPAKPSLPGDLTDFQQVKCSFTKSGDTWVSQSCSGPLLVEVD